MTTFEPSTAATIQEVLVALNEGSVSVLLKDEAEIPPLMLMPGPEMNALVMTKSAGCVAVRDERREKV